MPRETYLEIDAKRLKHNLQVFRNLIHPSTQILANLKGNAYGMDAVLIGKYLEKNGIKYFSVAYINEGIRLRKAGIKSNLLVFNPSLENFEELLNYQLESEVSSLYYLKKLIAFLEKKEIIAYPIHIKLDTGMHRAGIELKEIEELISILINTKFIKVQSVFSHLAAAEDPNKKEFTEKQFSLFDQMTSRLENALKVPFIKHILNTAGVFNFPEKQYDMIRPGLGIFGYNLIKSNQKDLLPIAKLKTKINQIKELKKGESVGYNNQFIAKHNNTKIALLPVGYADGISRNLGNGKWNVRIKNKTVPIIGNVSMDTLSIEISGLDCEVEEDVIIFNNEEDVYQMAELLNTIPYEITTRLTSRVEKRWKDKDMN